MASKDGVSSKVLRTSPLIGGDSEVLKDEYNLEHDTEHLKQNLFADNDDEDDVNGDGSSRKKDRGSDFLKVYKEGTDEPSQAQEEDGIKDGQVKFKRDAPEEERELKMPGEAVENQPVIQELSSTVFSDQKGGELNAA